MKKDIFLCKRPLLFWWILSFCGVVVAAGAYNEFLAALARRESAGNSHSVNSRGYAGLYQMGESALTDSGYYRADGTNKNDWRGAWTGKNGINSLNDFLNNATVQTQAITTYHDVLWNQLSSRNLDSMVGGNFQGVPITQSGLIAAAHLIGAGGLKQCLSGGKCTDGNNTTATSYMNRFGGFDVSNLTGSNPVVGGNPATPGAGPVANPGIPGGSNTAAPFPATAVSPENAFAAGSGVSMNEVNQLILGFVSVVVFLWAAGIALGEYVRWRKGNSSFFDMKKNIASSAVLLSVILFIALS